MKRIGIIGGLGPEATADYYKKIIDRYNEVNPSANLNYPELIIYSVSMGRLIVDMQKKEYAKAIDYLVECILKLKGAGADFAAISANTPHLLYNDIKPKCGLPLISIVESTCDEAVRLKLKRVGLIGTKFTMQATFYHEVFIREGIEIIVPQAKDIDFINEKVFSELEVGIFKDKTRDEILEIVAKMMKEQEIDSMILGCTEFPIMFTGNEYLGIPFLNTTQLHVNKIVDTCMMAS